MHELIKKPAMFALFFLIISFVALEGLAYSLHERWSDRSKLAITNVNCQDFTNAPSANYSATIIDKQNSSATGDAVMALIQKYSGDITNSSSYTEQDQLDPKSKATTEVDSTSIYATLSLSNAAAFMQELKSLVAGANAKLQNPNYSETTGIQVAQNCLDYQNYIVTSLMSVNLYMQEMPVAISHYEFSSSSQSSNISELNNQIQSAYNQIASENDNITTLGQNANKATVNITVTNHESPNYAYQSSGYYQPPMDSVTSN